MAALEASAQPSSSKTPLLKPQNRHSFAQQILTPSVFARVQNSKVLVVGAGGIGCEVLKDIVCAGFGNITIIDLDTIDLSNLNRQFLFNKSHIKKSKSLVAASVAGPFNPHVDIKPFHGNIKDSEFGYEFFQGFDVVLNALDNLDARRWVNRMCVACGVPLVESGTTGFLGQVQPIVKDLTACYDCTGKVTPKTYPVCTIRSTPSTPIHCVVWAKTWLFTQLFGEDDETEGAELDKAEADGGNSEEINALRSEALEMRNLRSALTTPGAAQRVFDKVFKRDVERLLSMEEMWRTRTKPTPIAYEEASQTTYLEKSQGLRDQLQLGLRETVEMFERSLQALASRAANNPSEPLSFDKDDDDALDFVTASSNLRSKIYSIEVKTRFDVKQMAGNIIPAIASTNAIISGALVLQAIHMLTRTFAKAQDVMLGKSSRFVLTGSEVAKQNPACGVCVDQYIPLRVQTDQATLGQVIDFARRPRDEGGLGIDEEVELGVYEGSRLLADPDFEDNHEKTLAALDVRVGSFLALVDEDGKKRTVQLALLAPSTTMTTAAQSLALLEGFTVPAHLDRPALPKGPESESDDDDDVKAVEEDEDFVIDENPDRARFSAASSNRKRRADGDDDVEQAAVNKKRKSDGVEAVNGEHDVSTTVVASASADDSQSKKRKVQDDGVIELD